MKTKNKIIKRIIILIAIFSVVFCDDIFRLTDPEDLYYRWGKSEEDGPPFFRFGNTQYYYHFNSLDYNSFLSEVASAFSAWNNSGTVQFSYFAFLGLPLKSNTTPGLKPGGSNLGFDGKIIKPSEGDIILNSDFWWETDGTQLISAGTLDVVTVILHEIGHIHGLAHPCTTDYDYTNGDPDAPIMAGADNIYFMSNIARSLRQDDINGTQFLQYNTWVPDQCSTLDDACDNSFSGTTIHIEDACSLTVNNTISSGITLKLESGATLYMNNKKITFNSGSSLDKNGQTISPYICLKDGSTVKGLYPNLSNAITAASSGETIEIGSNLLLSSSTTVPAGVTLKIIDGYLDLDGNTLSFGTNASIEPNVCVKNGATIERYYPTIATALSYSTTGEVVEVRDEYTSTVDINIGSGKSLKPQSGSTLQFSSGKYLKVNSGGSLIASGATFTHTSGTWGGIQYQSGSSGSIYNCYIYYASNGLHISNANPLIQNNTINYCVDYGLYVYNAYPSILTNRIIDSRVYLNACSSTFNDNLITGVTSAANPPLCSIYIYDSNPSFYNNTIDIEDVYSIVANQSVLEFGNDYSSTPDCFGYNELDNDPANDGVIHATVGSDVYLGVDNGGPDAYGYNSILDGSCPLWTDGTSYIYAQWCYWEDGDPAPTCYGNVDTDFELDVDPDGGSSLAKSISSTVTISENQSTFEDSLFSEVSKLIHDEEYELALLALEQIIVNYQDKDYAFRALNMSLKLCRNQEIADSEEWLDKISKLVSNDDLAGMIDLKKVSNYYKRNEIDKAITLSEKIPDTRKNKNYEAASLFNLFNFNHKDKDNLETAMLYLEELKENYPDNDLTYIARMDMGEEITYVKLEKESSSEAISEEEIVIPEEYSLNPAYPNPFNPSTTIEFALPVQSDVECSIFDLRGNLVKEYGYNQNAGTHRIVWDASDVSSGIYLIRFVAEASDGSETFVDYQKVTLLK